MRKQWQDEWEQTRRWYINEQGITMQVIPNPSLRDYDKISHSFAIASQEAAASVSRG